MVGVKCRSDGTVGGPRACLGIIVVGIIIDKIDAFVRSTVCSIGGKHVPDKLTCLREPREVKKKHTV